MPEPDLRYSRKALNMVMAEPGPMPIERFVLSLIITVASRWS